MTEETSVPTLTPHAKLYVLIPPSPLFAAHWSFFIPENLPFDKITKRHEESTRGRRIHVSGDRLNGFKLEIIQDYDISKHRSVGSRRFAIASVPTQDQLNGSGGASTTSAKRKDEDEGGGYIDNKPTDDFEKLCVEVEAPGPSLNHVSQDDTSVGIGKKKEVKDCQWWIGQVVEKAFGKGLIIPLPTSRQQPGSVSPIELVKSLPNH